jgi:hypothetical protein
MIFFKNHKMKKKSIYRSILVLSCLFILIGNMISIGYNLGVSKSFAQQYYSSDPMGIPSTISAGIGPSIKIGSNNLHPTINNFGNNFGLCNPIYRNSSNLPTITSTEKLMHTGMVKIGPQKLINKEIVGPDRFRFIYSYWTNNAANQGLGVALDNTIPTALETDVNGGPNVLTVVLHYEGVNNLLGITAALKLPPGFESILPTAHNLNRNDIAFSSFQKNITPGTTILLNFPITISGNVEVQKPYLGLLALHFLKGHDQSLQYNLDVSDDDSFVNALTVSKNIPSPPAAPGSSSSKTCNDTNGISREITESDMINKPFDFVHQLTGITFKVTGIENLNVNLNIGAKKSSLANMPVVDGKNPVPLDIDVSNSGDAPMYNVKVQFSYPAFNSPGVPANQGSGPTPSLLSSLALDPRIVGHNNNSLNSLITTHALNSIIPNPILNPNAPNPILNSIIPTTTLGTSIPRLAAVSPFLTGAAVSPFLTGAAVSPFLTGAAVSPFLTGTNAFNSIAPGITQNNNVVPFAASPSAANVLSLSIIGPSSFNIGYLPPHSSSYIQLVVLGSNPFSSFANNINTSVQYTNVNGYVESATPLVGFSMAKPS